MRLRDCIIPTIAVVLGFKVGCQLGQQEYRPDASKPIDNSGQTSVIVEYDRFGGWAEIRGPARFRVLDEWQAFGSVPNYEAPAAYNVGTAPASSAEWSDFPGLVRNPHYAQ